MTLLSELRLPREMAALWLLHRKLPSGATILRVRYTSTELVCLFKL